MLVSLETPVSSVVLLEVLWSVPWSLACLDSLVQSLRVRSRTLVSLLGMREAR
jgi:hypothetical protein